MSGIIWGEWRDEGQGPVSGIVWWKNGDEGQGPVSGIVWGDRREMRDKDQ